MSSPPPPRPLGPLDALSRFLGHFRWAFMPLGLLALLAIGVHAAANTLDDRLLFLVDSADAAFDELVGRFSLTAPLVDLLSLEGRSTLARSLALLWELAADLVLLLPALGYRERERESPPLALRGRLDSTPMPSWRALFSRCLRRPTTLRWVRPLATACVVLAGACSVAQLVQGTVFLSWRLLLGDGPADFVARALAVLVLAGLLGRFGWRAVFRSLQHADVASEAHAHGLAQAFSFGLLGSALVAPLALAAVLDASPVLSFLR